VTTIDPSDRYLDLLEKVLTRSGFEAGYQRLNIEAHTYAAYLWELLRGEVPGRDVAVVNIPRIDAKRQSEGRIWPADAETMVGIERLRNVRGCVTKVLDDGVPGDFIETGVWRGGVAIFIRAMLAVRDITDRTVWLADSFRGLPAPDPRYPADARSTLHTRPELAISLSTVKDNFRKYGLLDDQVRFLEGFFEETLPTAPVEKLAVLRLDGDMYSSTTTSLECLYDKVSVGGFVIIDDFGAIGACRKAVEDFRAQRGIVEEVHLVDWTGVYWRKS
jgi:O-methyltransferase